MNIMSPNNHYSLIGDPVYLCQIAASISENADAFAGDTDVFARSINDFRNGSFEERGRKAIEWMETYYSVLRGALLSIATMSDILYNVLLENKYTFEPEVTKNEA